MDKAALDRFLTTEPDNGYMKWLEKVWDSIPESVIPSEAYYKHEKFFEFWELKLSMAGGGPYPRIKFCADVLIRRYKMLCFLFETGWEMAGPDNFINKKYDGKKGYVVTGIKCTDAYEFEWAQKN